MQPVLDALPRAIVITDRVGTVVGWNQVAEEVFGWPVAEALGANLLQVLAAKDDHPAGDELFRQVIAGEVWKGAFPVVRRDGSTTLVYTVVSPLRDPDDQIVGIVGAAEDVSELRALEQRASDLADHLVLALAAGDLGTWRWDQASGITVWDETMERLFGLEPGEFDGTFDAWVARLHPDDADEVLAALDRAMTDRTSYEVEHRIVRPDGSVRWLQGRGKVTLDDRGQVTGTIGCSIDITDRKSSELARARRADELARLAGYERRERERLEFLGRLSEAALAARDHGEFLRAVTRAAVPRLGDWCAVHFLPEGSVTPEVVVAHADESKVSWAEKLTARFPFDPEGHTGVSTVIRTGEAEFYPVIDQQVIDEAIEAASVDRDEVLTLVESLNLSSAITVPLATKRGVIGAMQFVSAESGRHYDESDLALAMASGGRIAEALENMWLVDQQRHIATILQEALLPPALPTVPDLELAARYWAAGTSDVGGDFYDVFVIDDDRVAVVIGDVCGTGPSAAAVTGIARHTIRAAARHGEDHGGVLRWVDEALKTSNRGLFCSTCYATVTRRGSGWWLESCSGGHPLPVLVRRNGDVERIGRPGTILGILETIRSTTVGAAVDPGDTVVFYTDGLTDVRPPYGLTVDDIDAIARRASQAASAEGVAERIRQEMAAVLPVTQRSDDIAVVVLRACPPADTL